MQHILEDILLAAQVEQMRQLVVMQHPVHARLADHVEGVPQRVGEEGSRGAVEREPVAGRRPHGAGRHAV